MRIPPLLALLLLSSSLLDARLFTDRMGRTFEGELIASTDATVQIKRLSDKQVFSLPLKDLSPQDQAFVAKARSTPIEEPSAGSPNYRLGRFIITTVDAKSQELQLSIKYNHREVWKGTADTRGPVDLPIDADTDFNEQPKKGYATSDNIYLYIESKDYATQWHLLKRSGDKLSLQENVALKLHRKKYAIIEYAFYPGDENDFTGREPRDAGLVAVGHWGSLPGFSHDWQIWQGSPKPNQLWGDTPLLEFHRGTTENGMVKASASHFGQMTKAPIDGYIHYGACGKPKLAAKVGAYYYCRVVGHTESTRGYGKIHIKEIVETVPQGIEILAR